MEIIDSNKDLKGQYGPSEKGFSIIYFPDLVFLRIDDKNDSNMAGEYSEAIETF